VRVELIEDAAQGALAHRLERQPVAEGGEPAVVVDGHAQHGARLVQPAGRVADVAHAVDGAGALERRPTVFAHTARTGVAMARIAPVPVCQAESTTNGRTWSPPTVMWSGSPAVMNTCCPPHSEPAVSKIGSEPAGWPGTRSTRGRMSQTS
jgi:hypothetical protein